MRMYTYIFEGNSKTLHDVHYDARGRTRATHRTVYKDHIAIVRLPVELVHRLVYLVRYFMIPVGLPLDLFLILLYFLFEALSLALTAARPVKLRLGRVEERCRFEFKLLPLTKLEVALEDIVD